MKRAVLLAAATLAAALIAVPACALPVVGATATTLPRGAIMVDSWLWYRDLTRAYDDNLFAQDSGGWIDLPDSTSNVSFCYVPRIYYGVTDWLTMRASLPVEYRSYDFGDGGSESAVGLGDVVIDPKIQLYRAEEGYPRIALLAGVRIPTGDQDAEPALSDGTTDYVAGFSASHRDGSLDGHVYLTYWLNGETDDGYDVPDLWIGAASLENSIDEHWRLLWEAKVYMSEDMDDYHRVYACPGIYYDNGAHFSIGGSIMIPAVSKGGTDFDWAPFLKAYYRFF